MRALAFGGRGVCRLESGFVLLCDRATPGETVVARVTGVKGGGRFAEAAKVRTSVPSPHAVESPCPHFAECGGCTWQDVSYAAQLDMKREQVLDVLRRTAKVSPRNVVWGDASSARWKKDANARSPLVASALEALVPPSLTAPFTARYRNKMEFAFAASPRPENGVSVPAARLGLRPPGDHATVVEVTSHDGAGPGCLLQHPVANAVLASVQAHLRTHEGAAAAAPDVRPTDGRGCAEERHRARVESRKSGERSSRTRVVTASLKPPTAATGATRVATGARGGGRRGVRSSDPEGTAAALRALAGNARARRALGHAHGGRRRARAQARGGRRQRWVRGGRGGRGGKNKRADDGRVDASSAGGGGGGVTVLHGAPTLRMRLRDLTFDLSPRSFFQTNSAQAERLVDAVEAACGFEERENEKVVLDLFCGAGALGLSVAHRARRVVGWEVVPEAVRDATANAAANGIANATFRVGDLTKLERLAVRADPPDPPGRGLGSARTTTAKRENDKNVLFDGGAAPAVIICDPARAGMSAELVRALRKIGAERIVYVSCNPATQARDLARFFQTNENENGNENGNGNENASSDVGTGRRYRLRSIEPVDMFPNTPHVETVAVLLRVDDGPRDAVDEAR